MSEFRLLINGDAATDWEEESVQHGVGGLTAVTRVTQFRKDYPDAAITIERRGDSRVPNQSPMVRFKIRVGETTYYSVPVPEDRKEQARAELKETFPRAEIVEEV